MTLPGASDEHVRDEEATTMDLGNATATAAVAGTNGTDHALEAHSSAIEPDKQEDAQLPFERAAPPQVGETNQEPQSKPRDTLAGGAAEKVSLTKEVERKTPAFDKESAPKQSEVWLFVDNGGGYIKYGVSSSSSFELVPNCIARRRRASAHQLVGWDAEPRPDDVDASKAPSGLEYSRPVERGYVIDAETQADVWAQLLRGLQGCADRPRKVLVTSPPFTPPELEARFEEVLKSHFKFASVHWVQPAAISALRARQLLSTHFALVVDSGYSFTHVTPVFDGQPYTKAIRRIDVGGKLLTNYLKELASFGQINLLDDTYVVEYMKRDLCYVSLDIDRDLADLALWRKQPFLPRGQRLSRPERAALERRFSRRYVLPDFDKVQRGYAVDPDTPMEDLAHLERQMVTLSGERFLVPELLFRPSDIGIEQAGLCEVVRLVVDLCPIECRHLLRQNVILTGGNALIPNLPERLAADLGEDYVVHRVPDPTFNSLQGASAFASQLA
mmetsp:Transcript_18642/g.59471  ORF Transcript_18642/g.59471 Transcript_18642/m.59471 type:complete len:501 (-) Transcript_18642:23-1525(-)